MYSRAAPGAPHAKMQGDTIMANQNKKQTEQCKLESKQNQTKNQSKNQTKNSKEQGKNGQAN